MSPGTKTRLATWVPSPPRPPMSEASISTRVLSKSYGRTSAVRDLSLTVGAGEIFGFLGLNGAGKTTTIRMLLGMIRPTAGSAQINGHTVSAGSYRMWRDVGYVVETPHAYPELTVFDNLEIVRKLRGVTDRAATDRIIDALDLRASVGKKARTLSLGNAQRLGLAKALMHRPGVLVLDEPTNGLDPEGIVEIRHMLRRLAHEDGVTVFISSHLLGEVSLIADRIGIIHEGRLLTELDAAKFESLRHKKLVVDTTDNQKARSMLAGAGHVVSDAGPHLVCSDEAAVEHPQDISVLLVDAGCPPRTLQVESEDLEAYFLRTIHAGGGAQ